MIAKIKLRLRISSEVRSTKIVNGWEISYLKVKKPITNGHQIVYNIEKGSKLLSILIIEGYTNWSGHPHTATEQ